MNLHLATGQLGRPGTGPFSLTGKPNAMGGREVGAMATMLSAHRSLDDASQRRELESLWGSPPISPADAAALGLSSGEPARVISERAAFEMAVEVTDAVPQGLVCAPMHWSDATAPGALVNRVTHSACDPISLQPELKHAAVRVEPVAAERALCACHGVSAAAVSAAIGAGARSVAEVGAATRAGTHCGTCAPEIALLLPRRAPREPATVVVVGNGMVGHRVVERLVEHDPARRLRIVALGEEPRAAYDRVHLGDVFAGRPVADLALADPATYADWGVELRLGARVAALERESRAVVTAAGERIGYDWLVLATGSAPFVPRVPGADRPGVFAYRTPEDAAAIRSAAAGSAVGAVIGGGLLGLEAAKALRDLGLETHVVEVAARLMPRQLDDGGAAALRARVEALDVGVHLGRALREIAAGDSRRHRLGFAEGPELEVDLVVFAAGVRPPDELARAAGLGCSARGGVVVDDALRTSDPRVFAVGEVAAHAGTFHGLVAPGYAMADALAWNLAAGGAAEPRRFAGADASTRLKLLGVDVASLGDPFAQGESVRSVTLHDREHETYARLVFEVGERRLLGGILVGDTGPWDALHSCLHAGRPVPARAEELLFAPAGEDDEVCQCNHVTRSELRQAIRSQRLVELSELKRVTKAGTGCGSCLSKVAAILAEEAAPQAPRSPARRLVRRTRRSR